MSIRMLVLGTLVIRLANTDQADTDGDSFGNDRENCLYNLNAYRLDTDGDGISDACNNSHGAFDVDQAKRDGAHLMMLVILSRHSQ